MNSIVSCIHITHITLIVNIRILCLLACTEESASKLSGGIDVVIDERVLEDRVGEKLELLPEEGSTVGGDVRLSRLEGCTVSILAVCGAVRMDNMKNCTIYTGPIAG